MAYLNHNVPTITCFIRNEYLFNHTKGHGEFTPCDVHSVASIEKRVPLFEAFLDNGVNWTRRPIMAFCWKKDAPTLPLTEQVYWDCFSPYVDVQVRARLGGLSAELIGPTGTRRQGKYLFTLDWSWENKAGALDVNFSETPEHKCAHVFAGVDGNYFAYPNNRCIWIDAAWVHNRIRSNPGYLIDMTTYSVEDLRAMQTSDHYMTEFTKDGDKHE
jgi:hypothetical protein